MALIPYAQRVVTQRKGDRRRGRSDRDDARYEDRDDARYEDMTDDAQLEMQEHEYPEPSETDDVAAVDDAMEEVTTE